MFISLPKVGIVINPQFVLKWSNSTLKEKQGIIFWLFSVKIGEKVNTLDFHVNLLFFSAQSMSVHIIQKKIQDRIFDPGESSIDFKSQCLISCVF